MVIVYILFVIGLYLLVKSANFIVDGSSSMAKKLGISAMVIGLTVVAFGTSLPELIVNLFATFRGAPGVAFGNVIGSNIANILLVLGIMAIVGSFKIKNSIVWKQIPFALLSSFILFLLTSKIFFKANGNFLLRVDALILLSLFAVFLYYTIRISKENKKKISSANHFDKETWKIFLKISLGLIGIYFGARWVVDGAVLIASQLGLSEYLVAASIIAIGTSLPELVVCIVAVLKKNVDLAVGNIIGSNVFNILWVLGLVPLIKPLMIPSFVGFDIAIMFFATLLLFVFMFIGKKHGLRRKDGILFVLLYILYIIYVIVRG
jgi:cation:H+ antiporter